MSPMIGVGCQTVMKRLYSLVHSIAKDYKTIYSSSSLCLWRSHENFPQESNVDGANEDVENER